MTHSPQTLSDGEIDAVVGFLERMIAAGRSGRTHGAKLTPAERWEGFHPDVAAAQLPQRVQGLFAGYSWHRDDWAQTATKVIVVVEDALSLRGKVLSEEELHGALVAASYWVEGEAEQAFVDEDTLVALEHFSAFVNGFAQALPMRRLPGEGEGAQHRRFAAYQRRRYGADAVPQTPAQMVQSLPRAGREAIDTYGRILLQRSPDAAHAYAARLAIAMGRPLDETIACQLSVTLATAVIWQNLSHLPNGAQDHVLLGDRSSGHARMWDAAAEVLFNTLGYLSEPAAEASNPRAVQCAAHVPVAGVLLDAASLDALARLDEYVTLFNAWSRLDVSAAIPVNQRLRHFDAALSGTMHRMNTGSDVVDRLPMDARQALEGFTIAKDTERSVDIAKELATALGDSDAFACIERTLRTATSWSQSKPSAIELRDEPPPAVSRNLATPSVAPLLTTRQDEASSPPGSSRPAGGNAHSEGLTPFFMVEPTDAEALDRFGMAILKLIRSGQGDSLDEHSNGRIPSGWWLAFHIGGQPTVPSRELLMGTLPSGARRLLHRYRALLEDHQFHDASGVTDFLVQKINSSSASTSQHISLALAVGVVWMGIDAIARGHFNDSLLGAEPSTPSAGYLCGRAQTQLDAALRAGAENTSYAAS